MPFSPQALSSFHVIVVYEAAAAKGLFKELFLLLIRICSIFISSNALHDTPLYEKNQDACLNHAYPDALEPATGPIGKDLTY